MKKKSLTISVVTVDCGIFVAVRLSCLVSFLFIFKFHFISHTTVAQSTKGPWGHVGAARLTLCSSLVTDWIWDGRLQNFPWQGHISGQSGWALDHPGNRGHAMQLRVGPKPGVRSSHVGKERKLSCTYTSAKPARRFSISFLTVCLPKVFFVPLPRIFVPIGSVSLDFVWSYLI